jgi:hypothetical protein
MSNGVGPTTSVRWGELFPWLILVRAARVALLVRVLVLALAGVFVTQLGWRAIDRVFGDAWSAAPLAGLTNDTLRIRPGAAIAVGSDAGVVVHAQTYGGPLYRGWAWALQPWRRFAAADGLSYGLAPLAAGCWFIAVWALFGGAIARIAALSLTHGETIGPIAALKAATTKWLSTAGAAVVALIGMLVIAIPLALAGLLLRADSLALLVALGWILVLLAGTALAILAIGLALGWPLMWAAIGVERSDAFDAVSRAYAYVFQRPLHLLFYVVIAAGLGLLSQLAIDLFLDAIMASTRWAVGVGAGQARLDELFNPGASGLQGAATGMLRFWTLTILGLAAAFPMAYLFSAGTGVYLLLRRHIDSTEMTEAVYDGDAPDRGLPPLAPDPKTGVPQVAEPPSSPAAHSGDAPIPPTS